MPADLEVFAESLTTQTKAGKNFPSQERRQIGL